MTWAARKHLVIAPSPLEGEGSVFSQQRQLGEGFSSPEASCEATPSPDQVLLLYLHALSLEGRGHSNEHRSLGGGA
jgi:hypothetical protein